MRVRDKISMLTPVSAINVHSCKTASYHLSTVIASKCCLPPVAPAPMYQYPYILRGVLPKPPSLPQLPPPTSPHLHACARPFAPNSPMILYETIR